MLKRFILWDYPRASWQYDVMVGLILAFIFLTPKTIFRDQPKAASVNIIRNGFWIDPVTWRAIRSSQGPITPMILPARPSTGNEPGIRTASDS